MENKQTAVEWFFEQIVDRQNGRVGDMSKEFRKARNRNRLLTGLAIGGITYGSNLDELFQQALELEKEQNQNEFERGFTKCADTLQNILNKGLK